MSDNNGLFYYLTDHLGSTSVLMTNSNGIRSGSTARYHPFGSYRGTAPSQTITDRNYTGHAHNDDLGLIYMNARFYVSSIGRFASADTIVPDPMNPQQFNRYTYTLNNPVKFTDPTGHCVAELPCPDFIQNGVDYLTNYDNCLSDWRGCANHTLLNVSNDFIGMAPLEEGQRQREHLWPDYITVEGSVGPFSGSVTIDTYSNVYASGSAGLSVEGGVRVGFGYAVSETYPRGYGPNPNQMVGYRPDIMPVETELEDNIRGLAIVGGGGVGVGMDGSLPLNNSHKKLNFVEPSIYLGAGGGVSFSYGAFLVDTHDHGLKPFWEMWLD